jgi:hypothetical protein
MTQLQQESCFLGKRKLLSKRRERIIKKMANWRAAKARKRQEAIDAGWRPEPKFVRAYRFEFGVRDKMSGETAWHDLKSVRHAAKALGLVLKYLILILFCANVHAMPVLEALSQVESGDCDSCVGKDGEISRYQICKSVWRSNTSLPVSAALIPETAKGVALAILQKRFDRFKASFHREPTNIEVYLCWHRPSRPTHPRPKELERAQRFANLVEKI